MRAGREREAQKAAHNNRKIGDTERQKERANTYSS